MASNQIEESYPSVKMSDVEPVKFAKQSQFRSTQIKQNPKLKHHAINRLKSKPQQSKQQQQDMVKEEKQLSDKVADMQKEQKLLLVQFQTYSLIKQVSQKQRDFRQLVQQEIDGHGQTLQYKVTGLGDQETVLSPAEVKVLKKEQLASIVESYISQMRTFKPSDDLLAKKICETLWDLYLTFDMHELFAMFNNQLIQEMNVLSIEDQLSDEQSFESSLESAIDALSLGEEDMLRVCVAWEAQVSRIVMLYQYQAKQRLSPSSSNPSRVDESVDDNQTGLQRHIQEQKTDVIIWHLMVELDTVLFFEILGGLRFSKLLVHMWPAFPDAYAFANIVQRQAFERKFITKATYDRYLELERLHQETRDKCNINLSTITQEQTTNS